MKKLTKLITTLALCFVTVFSVGSLAACGSNATTFEICDDESNAIRAFQLLTTKGVISKEAEGDNYPVNAATFGGSDNRPEISRIGHTVENDDEGFLALFFRIVENSVGIAILVICRKRNDALMVRGPRYAFKFVSVRFDDGNAPVSRFRDNFDDRAFAFSVSNIQFVNGSSASQQFGNGISSRDDIFTVNAVFRLKDGTRSVLRRFSLNGLFSAAV